MYVYGDIECADLISLFKVNSHVFGWHVKNLYRGKIFLENIEDNLVSELHSDDDFDVKSPLELGCQVA